MERIIKISNTKFIKILNDEFCTKIVIIGDGNILGSFAVANQAQTETEIKQQKKFKRQVTTNRFAKENENTIWIDGIEEMIKSPLTSTSCFTAKYAVEFCKYLCLFHKSDADMCDLFGFKESTLKNTIYKFTRINLIREVGGKYELVPAWTMIK